MVVEELPFEKPHNVLKSKNTTLSSSPPSLWFISSFKMCQNKS